MLDRTTHTARAAKLQKMNHYFRLLLCSLGMTITPFLLLTGYLFVTRSWLGYFMELDIPAIAVSLAVGLTFIAWLPIKSGLRWGIGVLYVPVTAFLLFWWAAMFVCFRYGTCF